MKNTPSSIVCFKNGFSFMSVPYELISLSDGSESGNVKESVIGPLPDFVVSGTIGLRPDNLQTLKIFSISKAPKAEDDQKTSQLTVPSEMAENVSMVSILKSNVGNCVKIERKSGYEIYGRVKSVINTDGDDDKAMVVLETKGSDKKSNIIVHVSHIQSVESCTEAMVLGTKNENNLIVRYDSSEVTPCATLSYLTKGLTWSPSYSLVLDRETKTLMLEGRACIMCDIDFLDDDIIPEVNLVAGVPKMMLQSVNDPLVSQELDVEFNNQRQQMMNNSRGFGSQTVQCSWRAPGSSRGGQDYSSGGLFGASRVENAEGISGGETVEDFFHYVLKNVPLRHKHPISMNFIENIPKLSYEDVYYVDLSHVDMGNRGLVEVNHAISFRNVTGQPLTTAPATILSQTSTNTTKFLVQGMMKFTMPGQQATIEITSTQDVQAKFLLETKDNKQELEPNTNDKDSKFMISTTLKTGTVELMNLKSEDVKCKVEYVMVGNMMDMVSSDTNIKQEKLELSNNHYSDLNKNIKYTWELVAKSNNKTTICFNFSWKQRIQVSK